MRTSNPLNWTFGASAAALVIATACTEPPSYAEGPIDTDEARDDRPVDPTVVGAPLTVCVPRPAEHGFDLGDDTWAWFREHQSDATCELTLRDSTEAIYTFPGDVESFPAVGTRECADDGSCLERLGTFLRAFRHTGTSVGWVMSEEYLAIIEASRDVDTGLVHLRTRADATSSSAVREMVRVYTEDGRLVSEQMFFGDSLWFEVENTWDGGRKVGARLEDHVNGTGVTELSWTWDDGLLVEARAHQIGLGLEVSATYSYDTSGRIERIERSVDGQPYAVQSWVLADDNRLLHRRTWAVRELADQASRVPALDSYRLQLASYEYESWDASEVRDVGECSMLPTSVSHGYPAGDGAYHLGWGIEDRPPQIDVIYGFGPAYVSAQWGFFGHDAVDYAGSAPLRWWEDLDVLIDYDEAGRMVSERGHGASGSYVRQRSFEGGHLASDELSLTTGDATRETVLRFEWDAAGRLTARSLSAWDQVIHRQSWVYGDAGLAVRHDIDHAELYLYGEGLPARDQIDTELSVHRSLTIDYSDDLRTASFALDGEPIFRRTVDQQGRTILETQAGQSTSFEYDDATGLRVHVGTDWDGDEVLDSFHRYEVAGGAIVGRQWKYGSDTEQPYHERFDHTCRQ